jgi:hypothetical protein
LYLLDQVGGCQARRRFEATLTAACCADDGSACAVAGSGGEVWRLTPDLMGCWEKRLSHHVLSVALDPFGQYLAAADDHGGVHVFDRHGRSVGSGNSPRPLHYLAFVPAAALLVGSADYGLVAAFGPTGTLAWRTGMVVSVGSLAVTGDGADIFLACFSEGLQRLDPQGHCQGRVPAPTPCRLVGVSFDSRFLLVSGLDNRLSLVDRQGQVLGSHVLERPAVALAFGALGRDAFVVSAGGPVVRLALDFPR